MTKDKFTHLCASYLIDPSIALENEDILEALKDNDEARVELLLQQEF